MSTPIEAVRKVFQAKQAEVIAVKIIYISAGLTRRKGATVLTTFIPSGFPRKDDTVPLLLAMQAGGVDIIELGMPFSDPIADGPVIQAAHKVRM